MACFLLRLPSPPPRIQGSVRQTPGSLFKRRHGVASYACTIDFVHLCQFDMSITSLGLRLCLHFGRGLVGSLVTLFYQKTPSIVVCAICHGLPAKDTHLHHQHLRLPPGDVPNSELMTVEMSHLWRAPCLFLPSQKENPERKASSHEEETTSATDWLPRSLSTAAMCCWKVEALRQGFECFEMFQVLFMPCYVHCSLNLTGMQSTVAQCSTVSQHDWTMLLYGTRIY